MAIAWTLEVMTLGKEGIMAARDANCPYYHSNPETEGEQEVDQAVEHQGAHPVTPLLKQGYSS